MRRSLFMLLVAAGCSAPDAEPSTGRERAKDVTDAVAATASSAAATPATAPAPPPAARVEEAPYLAVAKDGPALEALLSGQLEVRDGCIVLVIGRTPWLAVFLPPARVAAGGGGRMAVAMGAATITLGETVSLGGGWLPPTTDYATWLQVPPPPNCPKQGVLIAEFVGRQGGRPLR